MNNYHEIEKILNDFKNGAAYSIEKVQSLIEAAREEEKENMYDEDEVTLLENEAYDKGRQVERGEQNRIHNSGRKLYQIGAREERQFILNILDGIDIADKEMGNKGGGTKAIRFAINSRIIP